MADSFGGRISPHAVGGDPSNPLVPPAPAIRRLGARRSLWLTPCQQKGCVLTTDLALYQPASYLKYSRAKLNLGLRGKTMVDMNLLLVVLPSALQFLNGGWFVVHVIGIGAVAFLGYKIGQARQN